MAQVYFNVNTFSAATVPTGRGPSLDGFYYETRNICRMPALSPQEKQAAYKLLTEQLITVE